MSLESTSIITTSEIKIFLNQSADDTDNDERIDTYCNNVTSILETYCDRRFKSREYIEYYDGNGSDEFVVEQIPITSITSIYDDIGRLFEETSLIASTDYVYYEKDGRVVLVNGNNSSGYYINFSKGRQNIKITYTSGYVLIPNDLKMIATEIIIKKIQTMDSRRVGATSVTNHGDSIGINLSDILPEHKMLLDTQYRKKSMGGF